MSTDFLESLKFIVTLSRLSGLLNVCFTLETGLLCRDGATTYHFFLEMLRTFMFLVCTWWTLYQEGLYLITVFINGVKYWTIVIAARMSEKWLIKFINGVIEFDRKLCLFDSLMPAVCLTTLSTKFWVSTIVVYCVYFVACHAYIMSFHGIPATTFVGNTMLTFLFHRPDVIIFVVTVSSCFYLYNLGHRFCLLNSRWQSLQPAGLIGSPGDWTNAEITAIVECIRLLHAELSELVRLFSFGYGPVLLIYFSLSFIHSMFELYLIVVYKRVTGRFDVIPYVFFLHYVVFTIAAVLGVSSWIIEKKKKIVSHLRLIKISKLSVETKLQVKMFMYQVSMHESYEFSAFGFFKFNLNHFISVLVLVITGLSTLIQMKEHIVLRLLNKIIQESVIDYSNQDLLSMHI